MADALKLLPDVQDMSNQNIVHIYPNEAKGVFEALNPAECATKKRIYLGNEANLFVSGSPYLQNKNIANLYNEILKEFEDVTVPPAQPFVKIDNLRNLIKQYNNKAEADKAFRSWVDTTKAEMQAIRKESQAAREKLAAMKAERDAIRIELPKNEEVKSRLADIKKTHDALMKQHAANEAEAKRFEQLEAEHHKATAEYLKQAKAKYEAEVKAEQERLAKIEAEKKAKEEAERKAAEEKRLEELRKQEELKRQQEAAKKEAERLPNLEVEGTRLKYHFKEENVLLEEYDLSENVWCVQIMAGITYDINDQWALSLGYRCMKMEKCKI